jgi:NDP-sugar pyrophosphorylase family protein
MKAMILAAGLGERMRPLTESRAKPSLPVLNRPIIVQTLAYLKSHGVDEAVINLHHHPESIRGLVGDGSRIGIRIQYSEEQTILGTAGGLKKAEAHFRNAGTFLMVNSDFVTDCDLAPAIAEHQKSGARATLIVTPRAPGATYGSVELNPDGSIRSIAGLPAAPGGVSNQNGPGNDGYTFIGIHIIEPSVLDSIPAGAKFEINRQVYPSLMQQGLPIRGYVHKGTWYEMGTPSLYLDGNLALLAQGKDRTLEAFRQSDGIYLDQVRLPNTVEAAPPILIGRGSSLGPHCSLQGGVVIGRQCRIGSNCALRSSILWDGARLGDRVLLTDCIVTSGVFIPPMTTLSRRILFRVDGYAGKKDNLDRVGSNWAARIP